MQITDSIKYNQDYINMLLIVLYISLRRNINRFCIIFVHIILDIDIFGYKLNYLDIICLVMCWKLEKLLNGR